MEALPNEASHSTSWSDAGRGWKESSSPASEKNASLSKQTAHIKLVKRRSLRIPRYEANPMYGRPDLKNWSKKELGSQTISSGQECVEMSRHNKFCDPTFLLEFVRSVRIRTINRCVIGFVTGYILTSLFRGRPRTNHSLVEKKPPLLSPSTWAGGSPCPRRT
jgi:hypothetical protein